MNNYIVKVSNDRRGGEYTGGATIADARKEAAWFSARLPAEATVTICKSDRDGRLHVVELAGGK